MAVRLSNRPADIRPFSFYGALKEASLFFEKKAQVHKTMRRITKRLEKLGIAYVVLGGMALGAHKYRRTTTDLDLLLTAEGLEQFREYLVGRQCDQAPQRPRRFFDRKNRVGIDILVAGRFPGGGKPGPIAFPDPTSVAIRIDETNVVNLATLIELKLAARRHRDFGDVVELIRFNELDESFADRLHKSVHRDFIECLEEKRREDEYEAREG